MLSQKFSAPKTSDVAQWGKVEYLVKSGFRFHTIHGDNGTDVTYPATLAEAKIFVTQYGKALRASSC